MKRLSELLEKQIPRVFSPESKEQQLIAQHSKDWSIQKQTLPVKTKWDIVRASVILQGVSNKIAIEKAYIKIMDGMENYWTVLDYQERVRILNIDLLPVYESLPTFDVNGKSYVIPFFDERLNDIYQQEMVVFGLKQYQYMMHTYSQWIVPVQQYGLHYYNGMFVPAKLIIAQDNNYAIYHPDIYTIFAHINQQDLVFPLFDRSSQPYDVTNPQLLQLVDKIRNNEVEAFLAYAVEHNIFSTKTRDIVLKKHQKKHWFSL